jgi:hypothetical protein
VPAQKTNQKTDMKKQLLLLVAALLLSVAYNAQDKINLVIFSEDGDAFFAYVNGIRQNDKPETNVKVTGLSPNVSLRIEFDNKALPQLKQNTPFEPGFEHTVRIRRDLKKQVKLTYFGQTPISNEPAQGVTTIPYHTSENPVSSQPAAGSNYNSAGSTTVTNSSTTTTNAGEDVNMNVNMSGVGISMNVNTGVPASSTNVRTTTSSTVTTRTSGGYDQSMEQHNAPNSNPPQNQVSQTPAAGCTMPMNQTSFAKMKQSVESQSFSDTKMSTAKVATKNACLSIAQVKEICKLFSMDEDKLAYAKYAYNYCVDKASYYQVSEVFTFSTTTDEFNKFLEQ